MLPEIPGKYKLKYYMQACIKDQNLYFLIVTKDVFHFKEPGQNLYNKGMYNTKNLKFNLHKSMYLYKWWIFIIIELSWSSTFGLINKNTLYKE